MTPAGIDSIEHGFYLDSEAIDMMLQRGTHFVPTLARIHHLLESGPDAGIPDFMIEKARRAADAHLDSFRRAREEGVCIAAELLRLGDRIGSIEPRKQADLVVLDGDPVADIGAVRRVHLVVQAGRMI